MYHWEDKKENDRAVLQRQKNQLSHFKGLLQFKWTRCSKKSFDQHNFKGLAGDVAQIVYLGSKHKRRKKMAASQNHHHQTEHTKEEEWGAVPQRTVSKRKERQLGWRQDDGCPTGGRSSENSG